MSKAHKDDVNYSHNYNAHRYYHKPGMVMDDWFKQPATRRLFDRLGLAMGVFDPTSLVPSDAIEEVNGVYTHPDLLPFMNLWVSPVHARAINKVLMTLFQDSDELASNERTVSVLSEVIQRKMSIIQNL